MTLAVATAHSQNRKIGNAAVTYAAQGSCPSTCPFLNAGCYAEGATLGVLTRRLNRGSAGASTFDIASSEAAAIDELEPAFQGQPMRLHSVGDCSTDMAAQMIGHAARRWLERGGGVVWTYTHAWREVARRSWKSISVLASCETPADVKLARLRGYATAIVVERFPTDKRYTDGEKGEIIPCPAQTRDVPCTDCGLCFNADRLLEQKVSIGFQIHGDNASVRLARGTLRGEAPVRLREAVPPLLAQGLTGAEIARRTATSPSSVYEMIHRLRAEGAVA